MVAARSQFLYYFLVVLVVAFYHLVFEIINNGQSPGKQIMGIKVVTLHGRTAKSQAYFIRWIFRMLEITGSLGIIAALYISSTEKNQRIGDLLAQTTVINLKKNQMYSLKALVSMGNKEREIKYPKVTMYSDSDMMLVKDALRRYKNDPNPENLKFVSTLSNRISSDLNTRVDKRLNVHFLETILYDYITLTR